MNPRRSILPGIPVNMGEYNCGYLKIRMYQNKFWWRAQRDSNPQPLDP